MRKIEKLWSVLEIKKMGIQSNYPSGFNITLLLLQKLVYSHGLCGFVCKSQIRNKLS